MEKIILAIDGSNLDMPSLDFACYLGRLTHSNVTGIFLENLVVEQTPVLDVSHAVTTLGWEIDKGLTTNEEKRKLVEKNIATFKEACEKRSVNCTIYHDEGMPAKDIIKESRFADLLVIDAATSFNRRYEGAPTEFVKDILQDAECPVVIAPESFNGIGEIMFAWDGSKSSTFAMKQFTYLFPTLSDKKVRVIHINETGVLNYDTMSMMNEWLKNHYSSFEMDIVTGQTETVLLDQLLKKDNVFVVLGAYGRSAVSRFFKHSQADLLIRTITQPIFVSHY